MDEIIVTAHEIENKWNSKINDISFYICLHYFTFLLSRYIDLYRDSMEKFVRYLSGEIRIHQQNINGLAEKIESSYGQIPYQNKLKQSHKKLCEECSKLRNIRKNYYQYIGIIQFEYDQQEHIIQERRDFIAEHFGHKGLNWLTLHTAKAVGFLLPATK